MRKTSAMLGIAIALGAVIVLPQDGRAAISMVGNNGLPSYAADEANGTFPLTLQGVTNGATVHLTPGLYDFTYTGHGDAANTNTFAVNGNTLSTVQAPGSHFLYPVLSAIDLSFTFASSGGCSIAAGAVPGGCSYLVGVADPLTAYLGFSDMEGRTSNMPPPLPIPDIAGTADYQDMVIKISQVPEPASMGLMGLGLLGLGMLRRRKVA